MPSLVLLAAGMGSRFGGLKQMEPVGPSGETLMDYSVHDAVQAGFDHIVFVIRRDFESVFRTQVGDKYNRLAKVDYAFQDPHDLPSPFSLPPDRVKPWGTGHATRAARHVLHQPFAVINADDFYGRDSFQKLAAFLQAAPDTRPLHLAMVGFTLSQTLSENGSVARGVCQTTPDGFLSSIQEMTKIFRTPQGAENRENPEAPIILGGNETASMNMWGFTLPFLEDLDQSFLRFLHKNAHHPTAEFYIPTPVDELIKSGEATVQVLPTTSPWFGITYREDRPMVEEAIRKLVESGAYPQDLWASA